MQHLLIFGLADVHTLNTKGMTMKVCHYYCFFLFAGSGANCMPTIICHLMLLNHPFLVAVICAASRHSLDV